MKTLTIIVPAYNMQEYLPKNLESIIASKSLDSIEVLVIDDGSTDSTAHIAERYSNEHPDSIRCISKPNGHYGSAVNCGIENAAGKFLKIVDSDDWVSPEGLDDLVSFLGSNEGVDLVITDYEQVFDGDITLVQQGKAIPEMKVVSFADTGLPSLYMHSMTYRTSLLRECGLKLDEGVLYTDEEFALFPIPYVKTVAYVPSVVYEYRLGRAGQSMDFAEINNTLGDNYFIVKKAIDWFRGLNDEIDPSVKLYARNKVHEMAAEHIRRRLFSKNKGGNAAVVEELDRFIIEEIGVPENEGPYFTKVFREMGYHFYPIAERVGRMKDFKN